MEIGRFNIYSSATRKTSTKIKRRRKTSIPEKIVQKWQTLTTNDISRLWKLLLLLFLICSALGKIENNFYRIIKHFVNISATFSAGILPSIYILSHFMCKNMSQIAIKLNFLLHT